ncbi:MAG: biopolymer transporter ExbD [Candidatus Omnitrophota bacterium]
MHFKRHMELEHGLRQIDIAPLVDIVFQLIIFFMLTSSFIMQQPGIKVKLPKAVTADVVTQENLVITISAENVTYFNGKVTTIKELRGQLNRINKTRPILIKSDKRSSVGRVVEVWDLCRDLGIAQVNIATTQD